MINGKKLVLFVDDARCEHDDWREALKGYDVATLHAHSCAQARSMLTLHRDSIDAIIWDGDCGDEYSYNGAIQEAKRWFTGLMFASSGSSYFQQEQMKAGCTHRVNKEEASEKLVELLDLQPIAAHAAC